MLAVGAIETEEKSIGGVYLRCEIFDLGKFTQTTSELNLSRNVEKV